MVKIKFNPSVFKRYEICGGHKFQYLIPGHEYLVREACGRTGFKIKDETGIGVWVSKRNLKDFFPNENFERVLKEFRK